MVKKTNRALFLAAFFSCVVITSGCSDAAVSIPSKLAPIVDAYVQKLMVGGVNFGEDNDTCNKEGWECKGFTVVCTLREQTSRADNANGITERIYVGGEFLARNTRAPNVGYSTRDWVTRRASGVYILKNGEWQTQQPLFSSRFDLGNCSARK